MKNNQPHSSSLKGGTKANTTQTYSQTPRPARNKTKSARRVTAGLLVLLVLVLGGGVYILYRAGLIARLRPSADSSSSSKSGRQGFPDISNHGMSPTSGGAIHPSEDGDLSGYTIIIDPGHGGKDEGCGYPYYNSEYLEKDFTLSISEKVRNELISRGATVFILRTDDSWVSLYSRIAQIHLICMDIAKERGILTFDDAREKELRALLEKSVEINDDTVASGGMGIMVGSGVGEDLLELMQLEYALDDVLFLSIHLNSSEKNEYHGTQIYFVTDDSVIASERNQAKNNSEFKREDFPIREEYYGRQNEQNYLLASCLYDTIVNEIPDLATNGDRITADNYAVIREHGLTGALIEVAFLTDADDRQMLLDDSVMDRVAAAIADSVGLYYQNLPDVMAASE